MIIILDGRGAVLNKEFEKINQGSNNSNKIHVIAPFPVNSVLNASFELPNGYVTSNYLMSPLMAINEVLNVWELSITDVAMTQYYGLVKFQIKAINDGITIATAKGLFKVEEGVDWQLPQTPDETTYVQILSALTRVDEAVVNKVNINYTSTDNLTEQMVVNSSLGLKLVKTKNGQTTTFEVKESGCYINGKLIANIDDVLTVENKIPTKVSELENNSGFVDNSVDNLINYYLKNQVFTKQETETAINNKGFITKAVDNLLNYYLKAEVYTKEEVNNLISNINKFKTEIVSELPSENIDPLTMYFIARVDSAGNDYYEEYLYVGNRFELIGTTKLDLAGYVTTEALNTALSNYVQTSALANYYTISEIDALIGNINTALETILGV